MGLSAILRFSSGVFAAVFVLTAALLFLFRPKFTLEPIQIGETRPRLDYLTLLLVSAILALVAFLLTLVILGYKRNLPDKPIEYADIPPSDQLSESDFGVKSPSSSQAESDSGETNSEFSPDI